MSRFSLCMKENMHFYKLIMESERALNIIGHGAEISATASWLQEK